MPNLVLPNEGLADQLRYILQSTISGVTDWQLMLYVNNITPSQATVYSGLTECTLGGYSRFTLTRSSWTSPVIQSDKAVSTYTTTPLQWTFTSGSQTIYGYAIVTQTSPVIRVIQSFSSPIAATAGGLLAILPQYTLTTAP